VFLWFTKAINTKKWNFLPVPLIEVFALPDIVERAMPKPHDMIII